MTNKIRKNIGRRGRGRPKGSLNKTTRAEKEALGLAFEGIGGVEALIRWAKKEKHRGDFYRLWGKLIPQPREHTGPDGGKLIIEIVRDGH